MLLTLRWSVHVIVEMGPGPGPTLQPVLVTVSQDLVDC